MLIKLALAPAAILLFYIYSKDKIEKEPLKMYFTAIIMGMCSIGPVLGLDLWLIKDLGGIGGAFYNAFITSAFTEETIKYIFLVLLTIKNQNLNNNMDGIVYAVAVSLGFAAAENLVYVLDPFIGGINTAISRSIFSVPAHCVFGISMGMYYEEAIFYGSKLRYIMAVIVPIIIHGIYNLILLLGMDNYLIIFIPYVICLYILGIKGLEKRFKA